MRKKLLALLVAGVMGATILTACGGGAAPAAETKTEEKKEEAKTEEKKEEPKAEEKKEEAPAEEKKEAPKTSEKTASPTAAAGVADDVEAVYVDGYYAATDGGDMMLAFYEVGDVDIAYATDGEYEFWSQYTVEEAETPDGQPYYLVSFTDVETALGYIDNGDGTYYLVDEDANVYEAAQLTEEQVSAIYDAVQTGADAAAGTGSDVAGETVDDAEATSDITYVDGYYANDGAGNDFMIAFYEGAAGDVCYVNDGTSEVLAEYSVEDATMEDGTAYILVTVGQTQLGYVDDGTDVAIITEDGNVYAAAHLSEEEADALYEAAQ